MPYPTKPSSQTIFKNFDVRKRKDRTDEVCVVGIYAEPAQRCHAVGAAVGLESLELLVEDQLEVGGADWLGEVLEVDVVVHHDAALAERLDLHPVEGVAKQ